MLQYFIILMLSLVTSVVAETPQHDLEKNLIPREVLFESPEVVQPLISPYGKYLAYLAPSEEGILSIHVVPTNDLTAPPVKYLSEKHWPIREIHWSYHDNILFYSQDHHGDEKTQLFALDVASGEARAITEENCVSHFLAFSHSQPHAILYTSNNRDPKYFDVWRYDISTQKSTLVYENNEFAFLIPDNDFNIRLAGSFQPSGELEVMLRESNRWKPFLRVPADSVSSFNFLRFASQDLFYFTSAQYSDTAALYRYDTKAQKLTALAKEKLADISGVYFKPDDFEVEAYMYEYERAHLVRVDKAFEKSWNWLENNIPGDLALISRTQDNRTWLIGAYYDDKSSEYLLFDRERGELTYLFSSRPKLAHYQLQKMHPVIITARDGLKLVSYLTPARGMTLDDNLKASKPSPLIILVHGGPVGVRDSWGFNPTAQFLANRGYSVLSINYRGSGGFGKTFIEKSFGQWSKNMQTDLIDGLNWAVAQGISTPEQISIMGGSYGGYAALVGLAMTPDLFASGIDIVGPSNLETLLQSIPEYWKPALALLRKKIGLPEQPSGNDSAFLASISPITYAHQIDKPLLIMHGANDPRVKQAESEQIISVLRDKQIPFLYALFPDEGHGFVLPENRIASYAIIESFLGDIFNTPVEPVGTSLRESSVIIQGLED